MAFQPCTTPQQLPRSLRPPTQTALSLRHSNRHHYTRRPEECTPVASAAPERSRGCHGRRMDSKVTRSAFCFFLPSKGPPRRRRSGVTSMAPSPPPPRPILMARRQPPRAHRIHTAGRTTRSTRPVHHNTPRPDQPGMQTHHSIHPTGGARAFIWPCWCDYRRHYDNYLLFRRVTTPPDCNRGAGRRGPDRDPLGRPDPAR